MASAARLDRPFLMVIAVLAWLALALQLFLTARLAMSGGRTMIDGVVQALSYFTVLTNLIVAVVATVAVSRGAAERFLARPGAMSATAVYIFIVGLIYALFLKAAWEPTGLQRVADIALHEAIPILYVLYWLLFVPKGTLSWGQPIIWLIYPLAYVAYGLLYGGLTGRYLYWFGDVVALGYPRVLANALMIIATLLIVGLGGVAIDRLIGRFRGRRSVEISN